MPIDLVPLAGLISVVDPSLAARLASRYPDLEVSKLAAGKPSEVSPQEPRFEMSPSDESKLINVFRAAYIVSMEVCRLEIGRLSQSINRTAFIEDAMKVVAICSGGLAVGAVPIKELSTAAGVSGLFTVLGSSVTIYVKRAAKCGRTRQMTVREGSNKFAQFSTKFAKSMESLNLMLLTGKRGTPEAGKIYSAGQQLIEEFNRFLLDYNPRLEPVSVSFEFISDDLIS